MPRSGSIHTTILEAGKGTQGMKVKTVGIDCSTSNLGIAKCLVDIDTLEIEVVDLILTKTESEAKKGVIKTVDNWRRAQELRGGLIMGCTGQSIAVAEIPLYLTPHPGMNANAASSSNHNSGIVIGVLAGCPIPIVPVMPADVKIAAVGVRNAAKEEMVAWAMEKYPTAPWRMRKLRGAMVPLADNEHLADAIACVHAGVKTREFQQSLSMFRSMGAAA
jgi:hypothetical protein